MPLLFDAGGIATRKTKRGKSCAEKMAIGALKYIAIKNAFQKKQPLYENTIFQKYFTDFYVLKQGSFSTPVMQEVFYRFFQAVRELYASFCAKYSCVKYKKEEIFNIIATILSRIAGEYEKSFSSKILHTLDNDSPIIDNNVLTGLGLKKALMPYGELLYKYFDATVIVINGTHYNPSSGKGGLVEIAKDENWDENFNKLCKAQYSSIFGGKKATHRNKIKEILADICQVNGAAESKIKADLASIKNWDEAVNKMNKSGVYIEKQIADISLVKKIDFYLWALFA